MRPRHATAGPVLPLLRGWSHTVAASGAVVFTAALVQHASTAGLPLATLLLYGLSSIWLFGCSAAYHLVNWSPPRREILRSLDHGNIYVATAATWTAVGANVLEGWQRLVLLVTVWAFALISVAVGHFHVRLSAVPRVGLCLLTGFSGVIAAPALLVALPFEAIGSSLAERGYTTRVEVMVGTSATTIANVARDRGVDLIVMATHGRSGLARAVLGSTATATVQRAGVPVLLTRPIEVRRARGPIPEQLTPVVDQTRTEVTSVMVLLTPGERDLIQSGLELLLASSEREERQATPIRAILARIADAATDRPKALAATAS